MIGNIKGYRYHFSDPYVYVAFQVSWLRIPELGWVRGLGHGIAMVVWGFVSLGLRVEGYRADRQLYSINRKPVEGQNNARKSMLLQTSSFLAREAASAPAPERISADSRGKLDWLCMMSV